MGDVDRRTLLKALGAGAAGIGRQVRVAGCSEGSPGRRRRRRQQGRPIQPCGPG